MRRVAHAAGSEAPSASHNSASFLPRNSVLRGWADLEDLVRREQRVQVLVEERSRLALDKGVMAVG